MSRALAVGCAAGVLAAGALVGTVAVGQSGSSEAVGSYAENRKPVPARTIALRSQRIAVIAMRRANAATAENRSLRQRLETAEARIAAIEATPPPAPLPLPPSAGAPGAPPGTPPANEAETPTGGTTTGQWLDYEIVRSELRQVSPGQILTAFVECPAGHRATGGGAWTGTLHLQNVLTNNAQMTHSWPAVVGGNGRWYARVLNPSTGNRGFYVYAACVKVGT